MQFNSTSHNAFKASASGRCGVCFQPYGKDTDVRLHTTARRMVVHDSCSIKTFGPCVRCQTSLDGLDLVAVEYKLAQHSCVKCASVLKWKSAPALRSVNRLAGFFKKYE